MSASRKIRESGIIDFLEGFPQREFAGSTWRIVRKDRDPLRSSSPKGRWDDGTFDVLYTSLEAEGAKAEMYFHIMRGQPVFPSQMEFQLFELDVRLSRVIKLPDKAGLAAAGVDINTYGGLGYSRKDLEYSASQKIAESAYFLDSDALIVPNARWSCLNAVLFMSRISPSQISIKKNHGVIDWNAWSTQQ